VVFARDLNRYRLLEPIRQFARQFLEASAEVNNLAERHAAWALRRSREVLAETLGGNGAAPERFRADLDNTHAALAWLREHNQPMFLRMVAALGHTWFQTDWRRGRIEARYAVTLATHESDRLRAGVLLARGMIEQRPDLDASSPWLEEARNLYIRTGDVLATAWATFFLGRSYTTTDPERMRGLLVEAAEKFHSLGVSLGEAWSFLNLGVDAASYGREDEARDHAERALQLARQGHHRGVEGMALFNLGEYTALRGDLDTGRALMQEGIELQRATGDRWNLQGVLCDAAWIEVLAQQYAAAESLVEHALRTGLEIDEEWGMARALLILAIIRLRQRDAHAARLLLAATGWENGPGRVLPRLHSWSARALAELAPLTRQPLDEAAHEGRKLGIFGAARKALR
jgi:hypothetical protein